MSLDGRSMYIQKSTLPLPDGSMMYIAVHLDSPPTKSTTSDDDRESYNEWSHNANRAIAANNSKLFADIDKWTKIKINTCLHLPTYRLGSIEFASLDGLMECLCLHHNDGVVRRPWSLHTDIGDDAKNQPGFYFPLTVDNGCSKISWWYYVTKEHKEMYVLSTYNSQIKEMVYCVSELEKTPEPYISVMSP